MFEHEDKKEEVVGHPENGDIFCCYDGTHIGSIDSKFMNGSHAEVLHIQILHDGEWHVYQLVSVEKQPKGEEGAQGSD